MDGRPSDERGIRRRIVGRPRLARLLDDADASVIDLVAPAGYGKTTLAKQWLASRRHAYYGATDASADVAALLPGLGNAANAVIDLRSRVSARLNTMTDPESELSDLLNLAAEAFADWPPDAWLVIDDYHLLMASEAAESVVESLWARAGVQLLVVSRRRPSWVTARRLLYGEVLELGRHDLAMDIEEAHEVLGTANGRTAGLVALAEGWPAVIGLAAAAEGATAPNEVVASALYDFFAEELLQSVSEEHQAALITLSVPPRITESVADAILESSGISTILDLARLDFLTASTTDEWQIHPLFREFLIKKFRDSDEANQEELLERVFDVLASGGLWDDAFSVVESFSRADLMDRLLSMSLRPMLAAGRLSTLRRWLAYAIALPVTPDVAVLLEAELAFRHGQHADAEALASQAVASFGAGHQLTGQALFRAGQAAYFAERYEEALNYLECAADKADDRTLEREARWAAFIAALDSGDERATEYLTAFEAIRESRIDDSVRMANARLLIALRRGGIESALAHARPATRLVDRAADPMVRTAFWNMYGCALAAHAQYEEALGAAIREQADADEAGLSFVIPHAQLLQAAALIGLRQMKDADACLQEVAVFAAEREDLFLEVTLASLRSRLILLNGPGGLQQAKRLTKPAQTAVRNAYAEYVGIHAVALAATGNLDQAREAVEDLRTLASHAEARALATMAAAICEIEAGHHSDQVDSAIDVIARLGQLDTLVVGYRAYPRLFALSRRGSLLKQLAVASRDQALPARYESPVRASGADGLLSPREKQVLELVAEGRTNEEIGAILFISKVTVKAHLRNAYEKLGVRNRVEAVAAISLQPRAQIESSTA